MTKVGFPVVLPSRHGQQKVIQIKAILFFYHIKFILSKHFVIIE